MKASPLLRTQEPTKDIDAVIEVLTVLQAGDEALEFQDFPDLLWPSRGTLKLRDYNKLFCPQSDALHPFDYFGIDRSLGMRSHCASRPARCCLFCAGRYRGNSGVFRALPALSLVAQGIASLIQHAGLTQRRTTISWLTAEASTSARVNGTGL